MRSRIPRVVLAGLAVALTPVTAAIAQDESSGDLPWAYPALAGITLIAVAGVTLVLLRRRRTTTSIDDRLADTPSEDEEPEPATVGARPGADSDVMKLLESPSVAPEIGTAVDGPADPWA